MYSADFKHEKPIIDWGVVSVICKYVKIVNLLCYPQGLQYLYFLLVQSLTTFLWIFKMLGTVVDLL